MATSTSTSGLIRKLPLLLVAGGSLGLAAAVTLMLEKIELIKNPAHQLSCDLNPILSCGSVINTPQAQAFGFANPLLGIGGFAVIITIGAVLLAGARLQRWFWLGLQLGASLGVIFVHWLIFQSLYRIGALCPYCMVVWVVTIPIFWYVTLFNLEHKNLTLPKSLQRASAFAGRYHAEILLAWLVLIMLLILKRFWYYWQTLV